jgi:L-alanine-DL-glutamate epimerase-like enolase superfamily enzyme
MRAEFQHLAPRIAAQLGAGRGELGLGSDDRGAFEVAAAILATLAYGPDIALMVDIIQGYAVGAAIASARHMEEADLLWIEEPLQPEDIGGAKPARTRCAGSWWWRGGGIPA